MDELFSIENVRSIRPGFGVHPRLLCDVPGKKAKVDLVKGAPLSYDYLIETC